MKIINTKNNKHLPRLNSPWTIIVLLLLVFGGLLTGIYAYSIKFKHTSQETSQLPPGKQSAIDAPQQSGQDQTPPADKSDSKDTDGQTAPQPAASTSTVEILDASQQSNGDLVVKSAIHGITSGTCTLSLEFNGKALERQADVLFQPEYSTCTGFVIPSSDLSGSGTATIKIVVTDPTAGTHAEISKKISIKN